MDDYDGWYTNSFGSGEGNWDGKGWGDGMKSAFGDGWGTGWGDGVFAGGGNGQGGMRDKGNPIQNYYTLRVTEYREDL